MIKKQKVCSILAMVLFIIGAGAIEGEWWALTPICMIGAAACILIGGLDRKRTNIEAILKEYQK